MWRNRRRQRLVRSWQDRGGDVATDVDLGLRPPGARRRARHRAPTPRLSIGRRITAEHPRATLAAIALALLAAAATGIAASDAARIHGAVVSGCRRASAEAVYAASGLEGASVLLADVGQAERRIMSLPDVQRATVRIAPPNHVAIDVEEIQPVIVWTSGQGPLGVDGRGRAMALGEPRDDLVLVEDESGLLAGPGSEIPVGLVDAAIAFGAAFPRLRYRSGEGFVATVPEGWPARLGTSARDSERLLVMLEALRRDVAGRGEAVAFADLRFLERPYYRLVSDGAAP
jgi:hypothetical protein